mgnify:CR=1 FL=1
MHVAIPSVRTICPQQGILQCDPCVLLLNRKLNERQLGVCTIGGLATQQGKGTGLQAARGAIGRETENMQVFSAICRW